MLRKFSKTFSNATNATPIDLEHTNDVKRSMRTSEKDLGIARKHSFLATYSGKKDNGAINRIESIRNIKSKRDIDDPAQNKQDEAYYATTSTQILLQYFNGMYNDGKNFYMFSPRNLLF